MDAISQGWGAGSCRQVAFGKGFPPAGAEHLMVHGRRRLGPQIVEEGRQLGLEGAATHKRPIPIGHIWPLGADSGPPGEAQTVGTTANGPQQGIHEPEAAVPSFCRLRRFCTAASQLDIAVKRAGGCRVQTQLHRRAGRINGNP